MRAPHDILQGSMLRRESSGVWRRGHAINGCGDWTTLGYPAESTRPRRSNSEVVVGSQNHMEALVTSSGRHWWGIFSGFPFARLTNTRKPRPAEKPRHMTTERRGRGMRPPRLGFSGILGETDSGAKVILNDDAPPSIPAPEIGSHQAEALLLCATSPFPAPPPVQNVLGRAGRSKRGQCLARQLPMLSSFDPAARYRSPPNPQGPRRRSATASNALWAVCAVAQHQVGVVRGGDRSCRARSCCPRSLSRGRSSV